jgi:hypothetical protein
MTLGYGDIVIDIYEGKRRRVTGWYYDDESGKYYVSVVTVAEGHKHVFNVADVRITGA